MQTSDYSNILDITQVIWIQELFGKISLETHMNGISISMVMLIVMLQIQ